jgi:hypothetical protein
MLEDTKAEIRSRKSKKDKQYTGKKEKEKQWVTFCCSGRVSSSCSTFDQSINQSSKQASKQAIKQAINQSIKLYAFFIKW